MTNENWIQLALLAVNAISGLAWFAIRREIAHVRELLSQRLDQVEKRTENLEERSA
jgi:hypothetical protein